MAKGKKRGSSSGSAQKATSGDAGCSVEAAMRDLKLDPRGDGMYSGTFRWLESKQFAKLPPFPTRGNNDDGDAGDVICLSKGWEGYLRSRSSARVDLVDTAMKDPSCLDALSFPVTFMHVATTLQLIHGSSEMHIVVLGATRKAEQRVWSITDYWFELAHFFSSKRLTLWFVGPEAEEECAVKATPKNLHVRHVRGTFATFKRHAAATNCTVSNTILIGYNTGFGNFIESSRHDLLFSWLPDLYAIADSGYPAIFTCANDYADMNGEFAVQARIIGARMLLLPQQNPFSAASHLHEEGQKETSWSRGNSFLYAIQGVDQARRVVLKPGEVVALQNRLDAALDLHLQDALGRHFFRGMVLSREQASRCKAITGKTAALMPGSKPTPSTTKDAKHANEKPAPSSTMKVPAYQLLPGASDREIIVLVHVPDVASAQERIAVDVSDMTLAVLVPNKYVLRATLPFEVENNAPVRAALAPPFLQITCIRKS